MHAQSPRLNNILDTPITENFSVTMLVYLLPKTAQYGFQNIKNDAFSHNYVQVVSLLSSKFYEISR